MTFSLRFLTMAVAISLLGVSTRFHHSRAYGGCQYECGQCSACCHQGTLFRWSRSPATTGGPALDEPLVTDRPDFTESSTAVGLGVAQLEFGYTFAYDDDGASTTRSHSWGEPLLRYGMLDDWLEFRIGVFPVTETVRSSGVSDTTSGVEDLYLGFKAALTPQCGVLPEMAIIPQMTVPAGSSAFTSDEVLPGINWVYAWQISDRLGTAGSTQYNRAVDDSGESYTEWAQSWTVAASLNDRWGAYTEWFALFPHSSVDAKPQHFANGGFTYLFTNDVQWDIRAGAGLNDAADDFFCGTGFSIRFR